MMTTTTETTDSIPVTIPHWKSNGDIDPMIHDFDTLRNVAGRAEELKEAMRWIGTRLTGTGINPETDDWETQAAAFFRNRATPPWKRLVPRPPFTEDIRTVAQFIARHGGNASSAQCRDVDDAVRALRIVGDYNEFIAGSVASRIRTSCLMKYHKPAAFYGGNQLFNNPNSGKDFYTYRVAWEGSFAFYVSWLDGAYTPYALRPGEMTAFRLTKEAFKWEMDGIARETYADKYDLVVESGKISFRFWWD